MPTFCMILATLFWGANYIFVKIALQEMHPLAFTFLRFLIAFMCVLPVVAFLKPEFKRLDIIRGVKLGLLVVGITFFQTTGLQTISASVSAFLTGFSVVFVLAIKLIIQKKAPRFLDIITALVCIAGLGLVTGSHGVTWGPGVLYTLVCAFFVALHTLILSNYAGKSDMLVLTLVQLIVLAAISGGCAFVLDSDLHLPIKPITWGALLSCVVFCSIITFGLQTYAQRYITAFKAAIILTLEPIFVIIFAHFTLGEVLHPPFYIGVFMIIGAIIVMNIRLKRI